MAKVCEFCGKGYLKGNLVCFSNKKAIKRSYPNIRSVRLNIEGVNSKASICTGCLSALKRANAQSKELQAAK